MSVVTNYPLARWRTVASRGVAVLRRMGEQTVFAGKALGSIGDVVVRYPSEVLRLIAQIGLGTGALAVLGGTVVIVGFLTMSTGAFIAVQGYNSLSNIGIEALTGFLSAFFNPRAIVPATLGVGLAATIGASATAQLGAMRINEEIDALEAMAIRAIGYLVSTRILAGVIITVPLFAVSMIMSFFSARFGTIFIYGQSAGVYDHYFRSFLRPTDLMWSFLSCLVMAVSIMLIHTYYGYTASGGPAGVGQAVGRSVRTSSIATAFIILMVGLAAYGQSGDFNLAGYSS